MVEKKVIRGEPRINPLNAEVFNYINTEADNTIFKIDNLNIPKQQSIKQKIQISASKKVGHDTFRGGERAQAPCVKCIGDIYRDAKIPFPRTENNDYLIDSLRGKTNWEYSKDYTEVNDLNDVEEGDIMITKGRGVTGKHSQIVKTPMGNAFFGGMVVINDRSSSLLRKVEERWYSPGMIKKKFITAFRYNPKEIENG